MRIVAVVNGLIAITVMAFAGTASALTYDIQDGNILAINNLELIFDNPEHDGFYNITFVGNVTVSSEYGVPPEFDFLLAENGVTAWPQITAAINAAPEAVIGASTTGSDIWFIPVIEIPLTPVVAAVGSENVAGTWTECQNDCLFGVRPMDIDSFQTFARVAPVPEPGTALLMGLGLAGLGVSGRRRREESQGAA